MPPKPQIAPTRPRAHDDDPLHVDDDVDDLAPLDGAADDEEHDAAGDPGDDIDFDADASSDDREAGDLPIGDPEVFDEPQESQRDRSHLGPPSKDPASIETHDDESAFEDAEASRASARDWEPHPRDGTSLGIDIADEIDDDDAPDRDDGGVEGTDEDISAEVDESALPDLDADGGAGFDVDDLMKELAATGFGRESTEPAWVLRDRLQWDGAFADVVAEGGRVVAAGAEIVELAAGATSLRSTRLRSSGSHVLLHRAGVVVATGDALLLLGAGAEPLVLFDGHRAIRSVALAAGRVWVVAGDALWVVASPPSTPQRVRESGAKSLAASDEELFLLAAEGGALRLSRFRGDDEDWEVFASWQLDPDPALRTGLVASRSGRTLAFADRDTLWHSWDRGASWSSLAIEGLVAFTPRAHDGAEHLVVLRHREGHATLAAVAPTSTRAVEIPCAEGALDAAIAPGAPVRLAWCDARETLFVATGRGLVALGPLRTH